MDPQDRPTAHHLVSRLSRSNSSELLENILRRMEAYAEELETAVANRTRELGEEQRKCDMLLLEMIPVWAVNGVVMKEFPSRAPRECSILLKKTFYSRGFNRDIVHKLRHGLTVHPELFESMTLSFFNLIGFVEFVAISNPMDVVRLLNAAHGLFDRVITEHDVYKVETIGDSYLVWTNTSINR